MYPYGKPQTTPVTEDHPRQPHTFKGRMRKEQEDVLLAAHEAERFKAASFDYLISTVPASIAVFWIA